MQGLQKIDTSVASQARAQRIAVLVPCFNEEVTIGSVINSFRAALPTADIYVYDNDSTDRTATSAQTAGAMVRFEPRRGKGNVVRRMFADIEADIFILVDGDGTYDAAAAPMLVEKLLASRLDFVNAARDTTEAGAFRPGHRFGNTLLTALVRAIFGREFQDVLSGYKVLSRRFVKSFPAVSSGFEIETELAVHALELRMPCAEFTTAYKERPKGSSSKLRTYRDGSRILMLIWRLLKDERPLAFFGVIGLVLCMISVILGIPLVATYLRTGLVPRFPTAILCGTLFVIGTLSCFTGLILDTVTKARLELKRLAYLSIPV